MKKEPQSRLFFSPAEAGSYGTPQIANHLIARMAGSYKGSQLL
jgi:hypothetical protein